MPASAFIELRELRIETRIGRYGPGDVVPRDHLLDLTLGIDPDLVLIEADGMIEAGGMARVFDYDPLIAEIDRLARDGLYETQERLITRIIDACCADPPIQTVEIALRKTPVLGETVHLGVRLVLDEQAVRARRG